MAVARGAGTEIIRCQHFEDIDSTTKIFIIGEQHHIYTILNITVYMQNSNTPGTNVFKIRFRGYDAYSGTSNAEFLLLNEVIVAGKTFVWNDKFSFNGFEPTDFASGALTAVKQNAIADQASSQAQYIECYTTHADDICEVHITYIDQNNA
jgi:hypothetical protein|tara:strand:+ start:1239 stop:1691 length:453 start_codon:yes stop_codon:yes gene_type:complete